MTQKLPDGITELQFCNNPAGSAYCVGGQPGAAGHAQDVTPPAAPGFALQARPAAAAEDGSHRRKLQFAPGLYGPGRGEWRHARVQVGRNLANGTTICPTNMSDSHVAPFTFTGAL